jgi:uncharacterized membrane protein YdjX (TVP38/TMEM64 family)
MESQVASDRDGESREESCTWIVCRYVRLIAVVGVLAGLFVAGLFLPVGEWFASLLAWTRGHESWTGALIVAIYVIACLLLLPGSVLTMGAGALLGLLWGMVFVSIGSTLGATAAFLAGRFFARDWVSRKIANHPRFQAIDRAVAREGGKIVLLTRLSPVFPFVLLNYGFGLTRIATWKYILASWLGMIPGTLMYVYIGSALGSLAAVTAGRAERSTVEWVFFGVGLVVTVAVALYVTRVATRALKQEVPEDQRDTLEGPAEGVSV